MGKVRRVRAKYHLAAVKPHTEKVDRSQADVSDSMSVSDKASSVGKVSHKSKTKGGIFSGLDIAIDNLNTCLTDDTKSVHSLAKTFRSMKNSLGGRSLKKDDKRKLRHDLFLSKIDAFYKNKEQMKKKGKDVTIKDLDEALPKVDMLFHKSEASAKPVKGAKPISTKQKGIKKAKQRQKQFEQNFEAFKTVMQRAKNNGGIDLVADHIQKNLLAEKCD
ncbi:Hypothetical protein NTJ_11002 [Nesidiocoris tenuis]|uniref:Active regulator of SIRT1 n=1 Tax=Nesidiocoris tenuis TaxID=355587 RepID=A0ABN7B187_9HEMI|nr:Hypothetical protein NTJ_11002 [Nesidiocoris tenuis]